MREAFQPLSLAPDRMSLLTAANMAIWSMAASNRNLAPTTRQLYAHMLRNNAMAADDYRYADFVELIERGLYGGAIDWSLCPTGPVPPTLRYQQDLDDQTPARELFLADGGLACWATSIEAPHDFSLVCPNGIDGWSAASIYESASRLMRTLDTSGSVACYLTHPTPDDQDDTAATADAREVFVRLRRILTVRVARREFNRDAGCEIWQAEGGVFARTGANGNAYNRVRKAIAAAERYVDERFQTSIVRPPQSTDWPERRLDEVAPRRLSGLIDRAFQHARPAPSPLSPERVRRTAVSPATPSRHLDPIEPCEPHTAQFADRVDATASASG